MKLFKKKPTGLHSAFALKKGAMATAVTAAFIICLVLLNVLITVLANKLPLSFDLTASKINSISSENIKYIRAVEQDVYIYMYSSKEDYVGTYMSQYAYTYYNAQDSTGKYFAQTISLLEKYGKYNDRIHIEFVDANSADSTKLKNQFANMEFGFGDLLIECAIPINGTTVTRQKVLRFDEIYVLTDETGYASAGYAPYTISQNNIETALTSTIYSVTSKKSIKLGLPADYCDVNAVQGLLATLENYNYEIIEITGPTLQDIDSSIDILLMYGLKSDLTADEIAALDTFLDNGGKKGKTLVYFAGAASPALPNFEDLLAKWGIRYADGFLHETSEANYLDNNPMTFGSANTGSEYTQPVNDNNYYYISTQNRPMEILETEENKTVTALLTTSDTAVIQKTNGQTSEKGTIPVALACAHQSENATSYVLAFSSLDFLTTAYNDNALVGNITFVAEAMNYTVGREAIDIAITAKSVDIADFSAQVNAQNSLMIYLIFMFLLPVGVLVSGILLFIKRKNR
ncbi:MAG: GldG family protein [Clostridia bacterium]|nr:GldG family protein [Clostridia bacterium]